ncbi:UNVERIFIED_CONTAM: hypothetical protein K2H54_056689 [Gekko kuhli]
MAEDEDLYIEAEVQTSHMEIPEGNRWRWSRLHSEVEVQTSSGSLSVEEEESAPEIDAGMQTSFLSLPREAEAQVQTSFQSLRSLAPFETEAQVQTSLPELPGDSCAEAQVQTSLLSLPGEREAQVQTSFLSLPAKQSVISIQVQPSYTDTLEKTASLPMLVETQAQTSDLEMPPSEMDIQVQTSFSDYMSEKEETSSMEAEQLSKRSSSQLSEMDFCTLYPLYIDAEAQTLPVEIPPGNDWRSARLKATAQVQVSNISLEKLVPLPQGVIQVQPSKLTLQTSVMPAEELEAPLAIKEKSPSSKLTEIGIQMSSPEIQEEDKQSLSRQSNGQVHPSTIELLKKLSVLSQIETVESASRTELLKKVSSLSVTDPHVQTSSYELQRKPSSLSDSVAQGQVLNAELLKKLPSSDYELTGKLGLPSPTSDVQIQTSDIELMKKWSSAESQGRTSDTDLHKYSSLSLVEATDGNQEEVTEGREYLITPQLMEAQIRKWYHESPEVQTASQAPIQREPLLSPTVDSEVQTSSVEIPQGNRWRASRLQADAEVQTSGLHSAVEEVESCHQSSWKDMQTQTSLLEMWQARGLADAQIQTSDLGLAKTKVEPPPPLLIDSQAQTSLLDMWRASEKAAVQTQTSAEELPNQVIEASSTPKIDRLAQTSFLETCKIKEPGSVEEKALGLLDPKEEIPPLQGDLETQTSLPDIWGGKDKTDIWVQTSLLKIPDAQEELPLSSQTDAVVQTSDVEIPVGNRWRSSRLHADVQLQTSMLDMKGAELQPPPPSQTDTQVQTSLLDIWKTKGGRDAQAQTSQTDMSPSLEEPPLSSQPEKVLQFPVSETTESSPPSQINTEVQTSLLDIWKTKGVRDAQAQTSQTDMSPSLEEPPLPSQPEKVVQCPASETAEFSPPSQINTEVQTSLLDIWKTKGVRDAQAQTSQTDMSPSLEEPPLPSQPEKVVQFSASETAESSPPSQINTEVQTSLLDIWKTKGVRDAQAQTSQTSMSPSLEEPPLPSQPEKVVQFPASETAESSPPSQINTEVQTSLLDIWKAKELRDARAQTSQTDMSPSLEEPPLPSQPEKVVQFPASETAESSPPSQINTEVQTSLLDIWKTKGIRDAQAQTSQTDMSPSLEEPPLSSQPEKVVQFPASETAESSPPSQINTEVQTSLLDIWKTKGIRDAQAQTSQTDMSPSLEEPPLPSQPEKVVQFSASETAESSPPSQINTEVQTSLLDIWKTKGVRDAQAQTSQTSMSPSLEEPPLPSQPEKVVQFPASETAEFSPPSQISTEVQTSLLDIWKTKDVSNSVAQTSQLDMSKSVEEPLLPPQPENVVQSPTLETTESLLPSQADTEVQTSFFDIWKAKELSNGQIQTSWSDLPESMEERLLQSQSESPIQIATPESPSRDQHAPEKQTSLLEMWKAREPVESSELPRTSPSPIDTKVQTSQLDMQTLEGLSSDQMLTSKTNLASATLESTVPSRTASPVCLPTPASVEAALLVPMDPQSPTSLLEVWTTRQEAEVQMQTASLGLSFDRDSPLFPILLESEDEKKPEQICKVEGKSRPPIFTEAQVQTSFVEIPRGKKWRSSRLCTEAQVQTSFPDLRSKDRVPALQKMVSDHVSTKR